MKKLVTILLCLLTLCACDKKVEDMIEADPAVNPVVKPEIVPEVMADGWTVNPDLPTINDAVFEKAAEGFTEQNLMPLLKLATQTVDGTNTAYLAYGTALSENPTTGLRIVVVNEDPDKAVTIDSVNDLEIEQYLDGQGSTTPDGLLGGWSDNTELPNLLSDEEKALFEKALEGWAGVGYEPICVLARQIVSGTNYAILALGTTVTANPVTHIYILNIYEDLNGNAELKNISGIDVSYFNAK